MGQELSATALQLLQQDISQTRVGMVQAERVHWLSQCMHVQCRILPLQKAPAKECRCMPHAG